jgi:hypothetical protein
VEKAGIGTTRRAEGSGDEPATSREEFVPTGAQAFVVFCVKAGVAVCEAARGVSRIARGKRVELRLLGTAGHAGGLIRDRGMIGYLRS